METTINEGGRKFGRSVLHEEVYKNELTAIIKAYARSRATNKFVYLFKVTNGERIEWMVNTHGVIRTGQKLIATYKLGEKCL